MAKAKDIETYITDEVKKMRKEKKISQEKLSVMIGLSEGFIGNVESPRQHEKYNIKHLNLIAKALECSPKDFWPENPL